jgi:LacI family transcriptional regulator
MRVPEDLSITGFDDIDIAMLADPGLTTVHVPHREMGRRAGRMLVDAVYGGGTLETIELKTEIRMRGSLGAPRTA